MMMRLRPQSVSPGQGPCKTTRPLNTTPRLTAGVCRVAGGSRVDDGHQWSRDNPRPTTPAVTQAAITTAPKPETVPDVKPEDDAGLLTPILQEASPEPGAQSSPLIASISLAGIGILLGAGYLCKDQIRAFLEFFITAVDEWGPLGYVAYAAVYTALEVLAVPAIPLTMTAGVIFGSLQGTAIVSLSGTLAATIAFLIARYAARDRVRKFAYKHPKFKAIDTAIGKSGLKFVTLLRLSPLLPLAASNYLYGLTSVDLGSYVLGSWVGMLPGTWAYVHAGAIGRAVLMEGEGQLSIDAWQVGLGLGATLLALGYVGQLAKKAIDDVEASEAAAAAAASSNSTSAGGDADKGPSA